MGIDPSYLLSLPPKIIRHRYGRRDTILYALGIGAGSQGSRSDLRFVYEERLQSVPTMAVILAYPGFWQMEPAYGIDWVRVLHSEQSCTFHRPIPTEGEVRGEMTIDAIVDKGAAKGCLLRAVRRIYDEADGGLLATIRQTSFLRGDGGCGSHGAALPPPQPVPTRSPDSNVRIDTRPDQALLYRLSGDFNPLHVDPAVATAAGLSAPILHGLCTYGIAGLSIVEEACGGEPGRLRQLDCRFTVPVYPGEMLEMDLWRIEAGAIAFRVRALARDAIVIDHGHAELTD